MKHHLLGAALVAAVISSGCTTMARTNHATDTAALSAQPLTVVTRPTEVAMELVGDASGTASTTHLLGFLIEGDRVAQSLPVFGLVQKDDTLSRLAAYRAARDKGADAFYVLRTEEDATGVGFLFKKRTVTVHGRSYRLRDLGTMSPERADKLQMTGATSDAPKKDGFLSNLLGR
jgi:hypothetical protein